jgi:hypothetical protein
MKRVTMVAALIGMALASESSGLHRMGSLHGRLCECWW